MPNRPRIPSLSDIGLDKTRGRFAPEIERQFQVSHYENIQSSTLLAALFLSILFSLYLARDYSDTHSVSVTTGTATALIFFIASFFLFGRKDFEPYWKIYVVLGGFVASSLALHSMASFMVLMRPPSEQIADGFGAASLFFGQQMRVYMICLALLRLPFKPALLLQCLMLAFGFGEFSIQIMGGLLGTEQTGRFLQFTLPVMFAMVLGAWVEEQMSRKAFEANYQLAQLQAEDRRKLAETEGMLHVLQQSIGSIVHDLGNPLTMVKGGAQTLEFMLTRDADTDNKETIRELTRVINRGSELLNFLRLSLIEQTRVLEGLPTPVELKPVEIQSIVEQGVRFQKPNVNNPRKITYEGEENLICADQMKMITVFMNLIGNALKYSDGPILVKWQRLEAEQLLLIAVCDQGYRQRGLTLTNAHLLFTAFGRLELHKSIEGTGLGLLSIQNIIAAHGGKSWIEGYTDGTPDSPHYSTGNSKHPPLLSKNYRTAFVVSCPLAKS